MLGLKTAFENDRILWHLFINSGLQFGFKDGDQVIIEGIIILSSQVRSMLMVFCGFSTKLC